VPERHERLSQSVLLHVAAREDDLPVVEEHHLVELARSNLQVPALAVRREATNRLGDRPLGEIRHEEAAGMLAGSREWAGGWQQRERLTLFRRIASGESHPLLTSR
jgi:hypothetical protein